MELGVIKSLETFTDNFVCFVRLETSQGHVGWGQVSTYNADITAQIFHRQIAPWALGADANDIGGIVTLIEEREHKFPGSYRCRAMAGLDTAMWDLRGKVEGKSVVELLGGTPGKLRAYASSMKRDTRPHLRLTQRRLETTLRLRLGSTVRTRVNKVYVLSILRRRRAMCKSHPSVG